jgi:hypothetical protein
MLHQVQHDRPVCAPGRGGQRPLQIFVGLPAAFLISAERIELTAGQFRGVADQHHPGHLGVEITERKIKIGGRGGLRRRLITDDPNLLLHPGQQQTGSGEQRHGGADHQAGPQAQAYGGLGAEQLSRRLCNCGHDVTVMHMRN